MYFETDEVLSKGKTKTQKVKLSQAYVKKWITIIYSRSYPTWEWNKMDNWELIIESNIKLIDEKSTRVCVLST